MDNVDDTDWDVAEHIPQQNPQSRPQILQRDLLTYRKLETQQKELAAARKALRARLLAQLDRGDSVESGALTIRRWTRWRQYLTHRAVTAVLGTAGFRRLCECIPRTSVPVLIVEPRSSKKW